MPTILYEEMNFVKIEYIDMMGDPHTDRVAFKKGEYNLDELRKMYEREGKTILAINEI